MVLSPGEHPRHGIGVDAFGSRTHRIGNDECLGAEIHPHPGVLGNVPQIGDEAVGDVDHGVRPGASCHSTLTVRRLWMTL